MLKKFYKLFLALFLFFIPVFFVSAQVIGQDGLATAAQQAGADAVYFGIKSFNMRAAAQNFSLEEIISHLEIVCGAIEKLYIATSNLPKEHDRHLEEISQRLLKDRITP